MLPVMQAVDEAEARGDAAGALHLVETHATGSDGRFFWNPHRVARLAQVVQLGGLLPAWATSRWILEQSLIQFDPSLRLARQEAMRVAIELRGGPDELVGLDAIDARTKVMDHDWVHRQLLLYEYGALQRFLLAWATPDLIAGADRIEEWVAAPMRSLRLEGRDCGLLRWTDLASGEEVVTPNLGAAVLDEPGDCTLARVVPTADGQMLDGVPMGVREETAGRVAGDPDRWLDALRGTAAPDYFADLVHGNFLVTDVPSNISVLALHDFLPTPMPRDVGEGELAQAVIALARHTATEGETDPDPLDLWPCVAAELLAPDVLPQLTRLLGPADADWLRVLSRALPEPAGDVCRAIGSRLEDAA